MCVCLCLFGVCIIRGVSKNSEQHHVMHTDIHTHTASANKGQSYCSSTLPDHILESESVFIVCSVPLSSSSWAISSTITSAYSYN